MSDTTQEPSDRRFRLIVAAVSVVIVLLVVVFVTRRDSGPDRQAAVSLCHQMVKAKLKSPASARFDADTAPEVNTSSGGPGGMAISGTVDSENGFGAALRSDYICIAHLVGDKFTIDVKDVFVL